MTRSASTGYSRARAAPMRARERCVRAPSRIEVGAGKVDVFEDAVRQPGPADRGRDAGEAVAVDDDSLPRSDLADELRADMVERRALRGDDPSAVGVPPKGERAHAVGVADAEEGVLGGDDEGVGAFERLHEVGGSLCPGLGGRPREQVRDDFGIGARRAGDAPLGEPLTQLGGVDDVAVVAEGNLNVGPPWTRWAGRSWRCSSRWWSSGCGR